MKESKGVSFVMYRRRVDISVLENSYILYEREYEYNMFRFVYRGREPYMGY